VVGGRGGHGGQRGHRPVLESQGTALAQEGGQVAGSLDIIESAEGVDGRFPYPSHPTISEDLTVDRTRPAIGAGGEEGGRLFALVTAVRSAPTGAQQIHCRGVTEVGQSLEDGAVRVALLLIVEQRAQAGGVMVITPVGQGTHGVRMQSGALWVANEGPQ
jgi:hypothetical protein